MSFGIFGILVLLVAAFALFGIARGIGSFFTIFSGQNRHAELNCPQCNALCSANEQTCKECGFEYR